MDSNLLLRASRIETRLSTLGETEQELISWFLEYLSTGTPIPETYGSFFDLIERGNSNEIVRELGLTKEMVNRKEVV